MRGPKRQRLRQRDALGLVGGEDGGRPSPVTSSTTFNNDTSEHPCRLLGDQRRLRDGDDGPLRGAQPARRLLRRLEHAPTWVKQGVLQPLNSFIKKSKYDTSKFYPGSAQRVQGREDVLRLPEGLVAARDRDQPVDVREGGHQEGAEDLGPARPRTPRSSLPRARCRTASRSASLPTGRGCWRSSSRTRARSRRSSRLRLRQR